TEYTQVSVISHLKTMKRHVYRCPLKWYKFTPFMWALCIRTSKMKARINRKAWSKESKHSYAYLSNEAFYEDEKYKCYKSGKIAVFSAQEQKKAYEVDKRYIWQKRSLCQTCYSAYNNIKSKISNFEQEYGSEIKNHSIDALIIKVWLNMLKEVPSYGKPLDRAKVTMLENMVQKNA
ncbi:MAG: hypothetical protein KZQ91_20585, partial [Candidatus Thiodiazotropha sp. (ex Lucinoma borealis)]|nr:hypothetical protein [Candidatus Thiodiazotropha sp. (ex Lucinoma borealis)]